MNLNTRLSVMLNALVEDFTASPHTSGSLISEAAARDLAHVSSNATFFRMAGIVFLVGLLLLGDHAARWISDVLTDAGFPVTSGNCFVVLLGLGFAATWIMFMRNWYQTKQRRLAAIPQDLRDLRNLFEELKAATKEDYGMFSQNLANFLTLMTKVFSAADSGQIPALLDAMRRFVHSAEFEALAAECKAVELPCHRLRKSIDNCIWRYDADARSGLAPRHSA